MDPMTGLKKRAVLLPGRSFCKLQLQLCCLVLDLSLFVLKKRIPEGCGMSGSGCLVLVLYVFIKLGKIL